MIKIVPVIVKVKDILHEDTLFHIWYENNYINQRWLKYVLSLRQDNIDEQSGINTNRLFNNY